MNRKIIQGRLTLYQNADRLKDMTPKATILIAMNEDIVEYCYFPFQKGNRMNNFDSD